MKKDETEPFTSAEKLELARIQQAQEAYQRNAAAQGCIEPPEGLLEHDTLHECQIVGDSLRELVAELSEIQAQLPRESQRESAVRTILLAHRNTFGRDHCHILEDSLILAVNESVLQACDHLRRAIEDYEAVSEEASAFLADLQQRNLNTTA